MSELEFQNLKKNDIVIHCVNGIHENFLKYDVKKDSVILGISTSLPVFRYSKNFLMRNYKII